MSELVLEKSNDFPTTWKWTKIIDIANVVRGASPRPAHSPKYFGGKIPWITVGCLTSDSTPYIKSVSEYLNEAGKKKSRFISSDTLLITNSGATLGVPKITKIDGCINDGIVALLNVENPLKKYLYYFLSIKTQSLRNINQGAAQPNLNTKIIKDIAIPLPPLNEQKRIVARIDELFSLLYNIKKNIQTTKYQLKQYEKSLLDSIFYGESSKNWSSVKISDVGEVVTGKTPSKKNTEFYGGTFPFFKPTDLNAGFFVTKSFDRLSKLGMENVRVFPGKSVLVTCIGATIGKTGFNRVRGSSNQQINSIIPDLEKIIPEYLYFLCISPKFQKSIIENSSSTTLPILNKSKFSKLSIPLASTEIQRLIIEDLERRFSFVNDLEKLIEKLTTLTESLKSVILKTAFEGKLVPQDPNDEPANILLEKIKHEKQKVIKTTQPQRRIKKNVK